MSALYEQDFYAWAQAQAALLREGAWHELDLANLIEEVDDLSRREYRALENRLIQLVAHLLKWCYQPERRVTGHSWASSITEQRWRIARLQRQSPSLRPALAVLLEEVYPIAVLRASRQTRLAMSTFPEGCPWTPEQVLDADFWPEADARHA